MKKVYPVIFFLLLSAYICAAQPGPGTQTLEDLKIAYITRELNLTPAEAQAFWPVYNSFLAEIKLARQTYSNDEIAFGEARLNIQKKYRADFKRILGTDLRVNSTFLMEPRYREVLRKELINRYNSRQQQPAPPMRRVVPARPGGGGKHFGPRR